MRAKRWSGRRERNRIEGKDEKVDREEVDREEVGEKEFVGSW